MLFPYVTVDLNIRIGGNLNWQLLTLMILTWDHFKVHNLPSPKSVVKVKEITVSNYLAGIA
jgi:hypothetical protein